MKPRALLALVLIVAASALLSGGAASGKACDLIPTLQAAQETVKDPVECQELPKPARISGRVIDSYGKPAMNVEITANPPGNTITQKTGEKGEFTFTFDKPYNTGTVRLTAHPLADQKITPTKPLRVKVSPGKTSFAKFVSEVGKLVGTVSEIICEPVTRATCGHRYKRPGARVRIKGHGKGSAKGVREPKFAETGDKGDFTFTVPPGSYEVLVDRLDVNGQADICEEDERLPVIVALPSATTKPAECAGVIKRTGGRENYRGRETVSVRVETKKDTRSVDFVAVPHRMVPVAEFATFKRGKRHRVTELTSGLVDPEKRRLTDPVLFGDYGSAGGDYDPVKKVIQCRTGCALIDVLVTNLLGEPLKGLKTNLRAAPVVPAENAVGLDGGSPTNMTGDACVVTPDRPGDCATKEGTTDKAGRVLGLYTAPGVVPGHALSDAGTDSAILAAVGVGVPAQALPRLGEYRDAFTAEPIRIRPNQLGGHTKARFTRRQLEFLDRATDAAVLRAGVNRWSRELCRSLLDYLEDLIRKRPSRLGGPFLLPITWCEQGLDPKPPKDPLEEPIFPDPEPEEESGLPPLRRNVSEDEAAAVERFLRGDAITLTLLSAFKVQDRALMDTGANGEIASFVKERRAAQGGRLKVAEPMTLELYEVSRLFNRSGLQVAQPAFYVDLRSLAAGSTPLRRVFSTGYDPAAWLP